MMPRFAHKNIICFSMEKADTDLVCLEPVRIMIQHQQTYNYELGKSNVVKFPFYYRLRTEDLECSFVFMSCRCRQANTKFNATDTQLQNRNANIEAFPDQRIITLRNYPIRVRTGERVREYVNGPLYNSIYFLDKFYFHFISIRNGFLSDKECLNAVRLTRLKTVAKFY